jgi:thioredoxin 1
MHASDIVELTEQNIKDVIEHSDKPVVIKAYAEWCGHCTTYKPVYAGVADKLADTYVFAQFDIDKQQKLAEQFNVSGVPAVILIKEKNWIATRPGAIPADDLTDILKTNLGE